MSYGNSSNPWRDDDFGAGGGAQKPISYGGGASSNPFDEPDDDYVEKPLSPQELLQKRKQESINRTLESSKRAMSSMYDSERMGLATADELVRQGEQLNNIETKTQQMQQDMKTSQKHLNNIKSVFGGIKNWWQGKKQVEEVSAMPQGATSSRLTETVENSRNSAPEHPAMRRRAEDMDGFDDESDWGRPAASSRPPPPQQQQQKTTSRGDAFAQYNATLDSNLGDMSDGMARLKGLALGLGDEIGRQNEQVDRINVQVDKTNLTVQQQNSQISGILGGSKKKK